MTEKQTEYQAQALAVRAQDNMLPAQVIEQAKAQADALMEIVESKGLYQDIAGKKYLEAEAWETILAFNKAHPLTRSCTPILEDGKVIGYIAQVDIMKDGEVISSGIMPCGFDELPCRGKEGMAKHKAAMSAAQTWALSKAARMKFAWVVVLAGYSPTPAAEMVSESVEGQVIVSPGLFCQEHKTEWFKRGKMTHFAHKIDGTENWCNMPKPAPVAHTEAQAGPPPGTDAHVPMTREELGKAALKMGYKKGDSRIDKALGMTPDDLEKLGYPWEEARDMLEQAAGNKATP